MKIDGMKETIQEMDKELERYNTVNQAYKLENDNQLLKIEALQKEIKVLKTNFSDSEAMNLRFRTDLEETVQYIQDPKMLKAGVKLLYQRHCGEPLSAKTVDDDVQREYGRQREYLERSVSNLKKKITKDQELQRYEANRFMNENASLIKEINDLRREVKGLKTQLGKAVGDQRQARSVAGGGRQRPKTAGASRSISNSGARGRPRSAVSRGSSDGRVINDEVEMLHSEIRRLAERNAELEARESSRIAETEARNDGEQAPPAPAPAPPAATP